MRSRKIKTWLRPGEKVEDENLAEARRRKMVIWLNPDEEVEDGYLAESR
jgi:hypothetical protein